MFPRRTPRRDGRGAAPHCGGDVSLGPMVHADPRPASRTRGNVPHRLVALVLRITCFPHLRGCSLDDELGAAPRGLFPAPAGMFPPRCSGRRTRAPAPCTCGDVSHMLNQLRDAFACSRHLRGCSRDRAASRQRGELVPAPAGMFLSARHTHRPASSAPRTRGGVPARGSHPVPPPHCFPLPRGCPRPSGGVEGVFCLLPVPAGMPRPTTWPGSSPKGCSPQ